VVARNSAGHPRGTIDIESIHYQEDQMSLFMDVHEKVEGLTAEAVAGAHQRDLEVQGKYGVDYRQYWFDEGSGKVFCLVEAPDAEAAAQVHREAHGLVADQVIPVHEGQ
jgi:Nickel responsive protein SCO4226-like